MSKNEIDEIKSRLDIVDVVSGYVKDIKKRGANYFALCPFHNEKTPSFSVNPALGIFKCFGCQESGDVISFIEKIEKITFREALEIAANKAGVKLSNLSNKDNDKLYIEKKQLKSVNLIVAKLYKYYLQSKIGQNGRNYLLKRNISNDLVEKFKIGFAPANGFLITKQLRKRGIKEQDLIRWGLSVKRGSILRDKFVNRIMFPMLDERGDVIGFSGRSIIDSDKIPKYLHSPNTVLFDKSSYLFGIYQARDAILKDRFIIFCEGQIDVISSHKTSQNNVVASLGTSLTREQLVKAKRYSDQICFCYDNDSAGDKAIMRAIELSYGLDLTLSSVSVKNAKDADELINKNPDDWTKLFQNRKSIIENLIDRLATRLDLKSLSGKAVFLKTMLESIKKIDSSVLQNDGLKKIAHLLDVDEASILEEFERVKNRGNKVVHSKNTLVQLLKKPEKVRERYVLKLLLAYPKFAKNWINVISLNEFSTPSNKNILAKLKAEIKQNNSLVIEKLLGSLDKDEKKYVENMILSQVNEFKIQDEFDEEIKKVLLFLKKEKLKATIKKLSESKGDDENIKKLKKLTTQLSKLEENFDK